MHRIQSVVKSHTYIEPKVEIPLPKIPAKTWPIIMSVSLLYSMPISCEHITKTPRTFFCLWYRSLKGGHFTDNVAEAEHRLNCRPNHRFAAIESVLIHRSEVFGDLALGEVLTRFFLSWALVIALYDRIMDTKGPIIVLNRIKPTYSKINHKISHPYHTQKITQPQPVFPQFNTTETLQLLTITSIPTSSYY